MSKKLVIHIGTPKTGTTSIQKTLGVSNKRLREYGLFYPDIKPFNHSDTFVPIIVENPDDFVMFKIRDLTEKKVEMYKEMWIREFSNPEPGCYIVSAESLSIVNKKEVSNVKEFVSQYFDEVKIIVYVRELTAFISSLIQQHIKIGTTSYSIEELLALYSSEQSPYSYTNCIKHWLEVFGEQNVIVRPFSKKSFYKEDLIQDFLNVIGFSHVDMKSLTNIYANQSIGYNGVLILSALQQKYPCVVNGKINENRGLVRTGIPMDIYSKIKDNKFNLQLKFNKDTARILNNEIDFINQFLLEEDRFPQVVASDEKTTVLGIETVSSDTYIELLNEYHKEIDRYKNNNQFYDNLFEIDDLNKDIYIWGASSSGIKIQGQINKLNKANVGFIDSDIRKKGEVLNGVPIITPDVFYEKYEIGEAFVIVGSMYYEEIKNELISKGFKENEHFLVKYVY